ncbi:hypothetical protein KC332_g282 [Hortaea werneckii]|nr:hypothetical protein KC335_g403 [Hortaea werneckii]KAI7421421.1 hypothetical protein KC332_g282 [Hortaea werneckii]KAI7456187.1 hypothetical protein KC368_g337 [Hortaea werneckii]
MNRYRDNGGLDAQIAALEIEFEMTSMPANGPFHTTDSPDAETETSEINFDQLDPLPVVEECDHGGRNSASEPGFWSAMGPKTLASRVDRLKRKAAKVRSQGTTRSTLQTQLDTAAVTRQRSLRLDPEITNRPILTAQRDGPPPPESVRPPPPVPLPGFLQGVWQAAPPSRIPTKQSQRIVAPRRLPQAPQIVTIHRRARPRTLSPRRKPTNWTGYGGSNELRAVLGLTSQRGALDDAPVLVAVDTESEKRGLINHVVEVGVTILRVRDIWNLEPGPHLRNWIPKMKHFHVVLDITRRPKLRMRSSLFGPSQFLGPIEAQAAVKKVLRDCMGIDNQQPVTGSATQPSLPPVYLVGQSVEGDVAALRGPGVRLDISDPATVGVRFHKLFDTYMFSQAIQGYGAPLPTAKLGWAVRYLGVDPTYVDPDIHGTVIGTHNAVNDAAANQCDFAKEREGIVCGFCKGLGTTGRRSGQA